VFENRVLRKIFGPRGKKVTGDRVVKSCMIFSAHQIFFRVIKSRRMRWVGHLARMGERSVQSFRRET